MKHICTFIVTTYGISGNELPPPSVGSYSHAVLSSEESEDVFRKRMQDEGVAIRQILDERFKEEPKPYSCADSVSWSIAPVGSITELVRKIDAATRRRAPVSSQNRAEGKQ